MTRAPSTPEEAREEIRRRKRPGPLEAEILRLVHENEIPNQEIIWASGLAKNTLSYLRNGVSPSLGNAQALLNTIGFELVIAPIKRGCADRLEAQLTEQEPRP